VKLGARVGLDIGDWVGGALGEDVGLMVGLSENIKTKRKKLSEAKSKKVMVHMWIQDNICFVMTVTYLWLVPWVNGLDVVVRLEQHLWGLWTE